MSNKEKAHKKKSKFMVFAKSNVRHINNIAMLGQSPGSTGEMCIKPNAYRKPYSENSDSSNSDMDDNSLNYLYTFDKAYNKDNVTTKYLSAVPNSGEKFSLSNGTIKSHREKQSKSAKDLQVHKKISAEPCVISNIELASADKDFAKIFKQYESDISTDEFSVNEKNKPANTTANTNVIYKDNSPATLKDQFNQLFGTGTVHIDKETLLAESNISPNVKIKSPIKSVNTSSLRDDVNNSPQLDLSSTDLSDDNHSDVVQKNPSHNRDTGNVIVRNTSDNSSSDKMQSQKPTLLDQKLVKRTLKKSQECSYITGCRGNVLHTSALNCNDKTTIKNKPSQNPTINKRRSHSIKYKHVSSESESEDDIITIDKNSSKPNQYSKTGFPYKKKSELNQAAQNSSQMNINSNFGTKQNKHPNPKLTDKQIIESSESQSETEFIKRLKRKGDLKTNFNDKNISVLKRGVRSGTSENIKTKEKYRNRNAVHVSTDTENEDVIGQQFIQTLDRKTDLTYKNKLNLREEPQSSSNTDSNYHFENEHGKQKNKSKYIISESENEDEFTSQSKRSLNSKTYLKNKKKLDSKEALQISSVRGVKISSDNNIESKDKVKKSTVEQVSFDSESENDSIKQLTPKSDSEEEFINQLRQDLDLKTNLKNKSKSVSKQKPHTSSENNIESKAKCENRTAEHISSDAESGDEIVKQLKRKLNDNADYKKKLLLKRTLKTTLVDSENNVEYKQNNQNTAAGHVSFNSENEIVNHLKQLQTEFAYKNKSVLAQESKNSPIQEVNINSENNIRSKDCTTDHESSDFENEVNKQELDPLTKKNMTAPKQISTNISVLSHVSVSESDNEGVHKNQTEIAKHTSSGLKTDDEIVAQFKRNVDNMMNLGYTNESLLTSNIIGVSSEAESNIESKYEDQKKDENLTHNYNENTVFKSAYDSRSSNIKIRSLNTDFELSSKQQSESETEMGDECEIINNHLKKSQQINANNNYNIVAIFKDEFLNSPRCRAGSNSDEKFVVVNNDDTDTTNFKNCIEKMYLETNSNNFTFDDEKSSIVEHRENFVSKNESDYENIKKSIGTQCENIEIGENKLELENEISDTNLGNLFNKRIKEKEDFEIESDFSDDNILENDGINNKKDSVHKDIEAIAKINVEKTKIGKVSNGSNLKNRALCKPENKMNKTSMNLNEAETSNQEQILYSNPEMSANDITQNEKIENLILAKAVQKKQKDSILYTIPRMEYGSNESDSVVSDTESDTDILQTAIVNTNFTTDTTFKNKKNVTSIQQQNDCISKNKILSKDSSGGHNKSKPASYKNIKKNTTTLDKAINNLKSTTYNAAYTKIANFVREKQFDNSPKIETRVPRVKPYKPTTELSKKPLPNKQNDNIKDSIKLKSNKLVGLVKPECNINLSPQEKRLDCNRNSSGNCAIQEFKFETDMSKYRQTLDTSLLVKKRKPQNIPTPTPILNKKVGNKNINENNRVVQKGVRNSIGADKLKFNRNL